MAHIHLPQSTIDLLEKQIPTGMSELDNTLHDVVESMALALFCSGVSIEKIEEAIVTAVDAYTNNC